MNTFSSIAPLSWIARVVREDRDMINFFRQLIAQCPAQLLSMGRLLEPGCVLYQMPQRDECVRLSAAERGLKTDDPIATISSTAKSLSNSLEDGSQTFGHEGLAEEF